MMKKHPIMIVVWSMVVALILIAIPTAVRQGPVIFGKTYTDSDEFKNEMAHFYEQIGPAILNPLDVERIEKDMIISTDEIDEHRTRYGSLTEQIDSIYEQYADSISEAKEAENKRLAERLIQERDDKIADIEKNFESDEYIEGKIRAEKVAIIKQYVKEIKGKVSTNIPVSYELKDVKTGEVFSNGDIGRNAAYQRTFDEDNGYLKAYSINSNDEYTSYAYGDQATDIEHIVVEDTMYELVHGYLKNSQNPVREFEGIVAVSEEAIEKSYADGYLPGYYQYKYKNYFLWVLVGIGFILLFTVLKFRMEWVTNTRFVLTYYQWSFDIKILLFLLTLFFTTNIIYDQAVWAFFEPQNYWGTWLDRLIWFAALVFVTWWIAFQLVNCFEHWKKKGMLAAEIKNSYAFYFLKAIQEMFLNRSVGVQMFILLIGFFLAGAGFILSMVGYGFIMLYIPAVLFLGLPALYIFVRRSAYMSQIFKATEEMAAGRLNKEIKVKGKSPFAKHAANLNNLREGVQVSITAQAKSERLKTELITNVSHDLRTPLTSIITYTDLLKNEDLSVEDRLKYVSILDKKSQRLKTLIEDLFEVSKMASGNLELNKQRVDLTQLFQQALAEHEDDIIASGLDFRVNLPETALVANVDGQKWWRVLDNLIVNAIKYSMSGTRVYITLQQENGRAQFIFKNISMYELNAEGEELFERFKRADTSRHTDGSGLGLAIAQSIVDMHAGEMNIDVDGDLFKVTVEVPIV